jgi:hypothetical protein
MKGIESVSLKECAFKCMLNEPPVRLGELVEAGREMAGNYRLTANRRDPMGKSRSTTDRQLQWRTAPFH